LIFDNHNRLINYLRLAVTDRCNLRCFYCMPAEGIRYLPKNELLSFEELVRVVSVLAEMGITKIRLTGGEPFLRKDLLQLMKMIRQIPGIKELHLTTNGLLAGDHIDELRQLVDSVNLSLDTLDRDRFHQITRRDEFEKCWTAFHKIRQARIPVKLNMVVMDGKNTDDIIPMAELSREEGISVRFIEEMPFNGTGSFHQQINWDHVAILNLLRSHYPDLKRLPSGPGATASLYEIPGYNGTVGIIAAYSRTFCGTCNRIRLTAQGILKTCLYDQGVLSVRDLLRSGVSDDDLKASLMQSFRERPKDGFEAEKASGVFQSMSTIGG